MKKVFLLLGFGLASSFLAQIQKVELTSEEIHFIAKSKVGMFDIDENAVAKNISLNKSLLSFEIEYNNEILYRGSINKWNPMAYSITQETGRTSVGVCLKYSDFPSEIVLELLEKEDWKSYKIRDEKLICNENYDVFKKDLSQGKYLPNHIIKGKIETRLYRLDE